MANLPAGTNTDTYWLQTLAYLLSLALIPTGGKCIYGQIRLWLTRFFGNIAVVANKWVRIFVIKSIVSVGIFHLLTHQLLTNCIVASFSSSGHWIKDCQNDQWLLAQGLKAMWIRGFSQISSWDWIQQHPRSQDMRGDFYVGKSKWSRISINRALSNDLFKEKLLKDSYVCSRSK